MSYRKFLLLPHLKIHNANAMSSPYTIGFPAMTAWLGGIHALQRYLHQQGLGDVQLNSVAVSCHHFDLQTYKGQGDYTYSIIGTANPLNNKGERPSFIEEARCHLDVSLLIEFTGLDSDDRLDSDDQDNFIQLTNQQILRMKFASGDVLSAKLAECLSVDEDDESTVRMLLRKLMLGHVLLERRELLQDTMQQDNKDALDALLDYLTIQHRATQENETITWKSGRKTTGWLVPIAVGFQGISPLGKAKNQRDMDTEHRFAESIVTLGEFVMPYRVRNLNDMLWQYHVNPDKGMYLCQTLTSLHSNA